MNRRDLIKFLSATAVTPLLPWQKEVVQHIGLDMANGSDMTAISFHPRGSVVNSKSIDAFTKREICKYFRVPEHMIEGTCSSPVKVRKSPEMVAWIDEYHDIDQT